MDRKELQSILQDYSENISSPNITHEMLTIALEHANKMNFIDIKIRLLELISAKHYIYGNDKNAIDLLFEALILAKQINIKNEIGFIQGRIGAYYSTMGLFEQAFHYFMNSLDNTDNSFVDPRGNIYNNIAITLYHRELFDEAEEYNQKALQWVKKNYNTPKKLFLQYSSLADMYIRMNNLELTRKYSALCKESLPNPSKLYSFVHYYNDACILAMEGDFENSTKKIKYMYDELYVGKIPIYYYDSIQAWGLLLEKHNEIEYTFDILKTIYDVNDKFESESLIDIIWLLALAYEKKNDYKNATKYFMILSKKRRELYHKNQQMVSHNNIKIIKLTQQYNNLSIKSTKDGLTGWLNRTALGDNGQQILKDTVLSNNSMAVIMFDIDYFKQFNDNNGHQLGDECLRKVCKIINEIHPEQTKYLYRYGGDEFMIMWELDNLTTADIAKLMLNEVNKAKIPHKHSINYNHVTISIGAVTVNDVTAKLREVIDIADLNLYKAKAAGRNRATVDGVHIT